jgi:hypothetical protein
MEDTYVLTWRGVVYIPWRKIRQPDSVGIYEMLAICYSSLI